MTKAYKDKTLTNKDIDSIPDKIEKTGLNKRVVVAVMLDSKCVDTKDVKAPSKKKKQY